MATPPLLLTKRLATFLHANQSAALPTLLLTTPQGRLLAHASRLPAAILRTYATVAASLLSIHATSSPCIPAALPGAHSPQPTQAPAPQITPSTITVQLSGGTIVIRRLKCGLLFVCVGPPGNGPAGEDGVVEGAGLMVQALGVAGEAGMGSSPSEVESLGGRSTCSLDSVGATAVVAMRRQAAELARWLDDKLGTLKVPEERLGSGLD